MNTKFLWIGRTALLAVVLGLYTGCAHIPENPDKPVSYSMAPMSEGTLATASDAVLTQAAAEESAFMLIANNAAAMNWRLALVDSAMDSIDLQVFIWSNDESGRLLLHRILEAANRGVQVRLLVDDMPKDWSDYGTALVARHKNVQLRRFNPGRVRKGMIGRAFQMSTQFQKLNRRMHNKQLIVDGRWAVVGGRNIGNPYFGLSKKYNNRDLDLLLTGTVITEMAEDFDEYWNADAAYPGEAMYKEVSESKTRKTFEKLNEALAKDRELIDQTPIEGDPIDWSDWFAPLPTKMAFGTAQCLQDAPIVEGERGVRLVDQLDQIDIEPEHVSSIITPYLIPSDKQLESIRVITEEKGRRIRLLAPAMESNNHTMAHSHYKKYRKKILRNGAELYEFRGQPSEELRADSDTPPIRSKFISLHTKAFVLDQRYVLLGSLNIDPRSIEINTEHMLIIDSPVLAQRLYDQYAEMTAPENAWKVSLNEKGKLRWTSSEGVVKNQPARGFGQRCSDFFWRLMPVESQL